MRKGKLFTCMLCGAHWRTLALNSYFTRSTRLVSSARWPPPLLFVVYAVFVQESALSIGIIVNLDLMRLCTVCVFGWYTHASNW